MVIFLLLEYSIYGGWIFALNSCEVCQIRGKLLSRFIFFFLFHCICNKFTFKIRT